MTGAALNHRLLRPDRKMDFSGLASVWREERIQMRLAGMAGFACSPSLLNKVRGALGCVLLESASGAVRERRPCTWSPPCAADVFFGAKPQVRIGAFSSEISKPWVLKARQDEEDLIIAMTVFGLAQGWTGEVAAALVTGLQSRVRWRDLAKDRQLFVPASPEIIERRFITIEKINIPLAPQRICVEFRTALDAERGTPDERPHLLFDRLVRRVSLLARWQGVEVVTDLDILQEDWRACAYDVENWSGRDSGRPERRGGHKFKNRLACDGAMTIGGDLQRLWPLLVIGEHTNVGRGASIGLGCYGLVRPDGC